MLSVPSESERVRWRSFSCAEKFRKVRNEPTMSEFYQRYNGQGLEEVTALRHQEAQQVLLQQDRLPPVRGHVPRHRRGRRGQVQVRVSIQRSVVAVRRKLRWKTEDLNSR